MACLIPVVPLLSMSIKLGGDLFYHGFEEGYPESKGVRITRPFIRGAHSGEANPQRTLFIYCINTMEMEKSARTQSGAEGDGLNLSNQ